MYGYGLKKKYKCLIISKTQTIFAVVPDIRFLIFNRKLDESIYKGHHINIKHLTIENKTFCWEIKI